MSIIDLPYDSIYLTEDAILNALSLGRNNSNDQKTDTPSSQNQGNDVDKDKGTNQTDTKNQSNDTNQSKITNQTDKKDQSNDTNKVNDTNQTDKNDQGSETSKDKDTNKSENDAKEKEDEDAKEKKEPEQLGPKPKVTEDGTLYATCHLGKDWKYPWNATAYFWEKPGGPLNVKIVGTGEPKG